MKVGWSSSVVRKVDKPESWLAFHGFLVAFAWEMFQMPYYNMDHLTAWQVTKSCGIASFGDAGIMVFSYWLASRSGGGQLWLHSRHTSALVVYLLAGLAITVAFEHLALRSDWGWRYSEIMPTLFGIGIVPIVMWVAVPLLTLRLAARSSSIKTLL